jgi:hypothetical protein
MPAYDNQTATDRAAVPCFIDVNRGDGAARVRVRGNCLIDTGAQCNLISPAMAEELRNLGSDSYRLLCSAETSIGICVTFKLEVPNNDPIPIPFCADVIDGLPYGMVLGLNTIRKYDLSVPLGYLFKASAGETDARLGLGAWDGARVGESLSSNSLHRQPLTRAPREGQNAIVGLVVHQTVLLGSKVAEEDVFKGKTDRCQKAHRRERRTCSICGDKHLREEGGSVTPL